MNCIRDKLASYFAIAVFAFVLENTVHAATLYSTGFEPPTYIPGDINGQDGWTSGVGNSSTGGPGANSAALVTTNNPSSGIQALVLDGSRLTSSNGFQPSVFADHSFNYNANNTPVLTLQADMRLDGPVSTGTLAESNLQTYFGQWVIDSNGMAYAQKFGYNGNPTVTLFSMPVNLAQYYTLGIRLNYASGVMSFFYNGAAEASTDFVPSPILNGARTQLAIFSTGNPADYKAYFDNYIVTAEVPEAESAEYVIIGILLLLSFGRRLKKQAP